MHFRDQEMSNPRHWPATARSRSTLRFWGVGIGEPSEVERVSMAYCTDVSPVDLNTQAISAGVWSSHMKETGFEEEDLNSAGVGPRWGAMTVLKNSS